MNQNSTLQAPVEFRRNESFNPQHTAKDSKEYYPIVTKATRTSTENFNNNDRSANYERKPSASFMTDYLQQDQRSAQDTIQTPLVKQSFAQQYQPKTDKPTLEVFKY